MATRRSTRVRKVIPIAEKLLKETEEDADFWGQDAFADDEEDGEFNENEASDQGEDMVDSDFDAPEAADEDDGTAAEKEARAVERIERKKSGGGGYVDPAKKSKRKPAPPPTTPKTPQQKTPTSSRKSAPSIPSRPLSLRNSTRRASLKAAERREQQDKESAKRRAQKAARDAKKKPVREMTQEERLAEAVKTEEENRESLKDLLRLEEERKRIPTRKKAKSGPTMTILDRGGVATISMPKDVDANKILFPQLVVAAKDKQEEEEE